MAKRNIFRAKAVTRISVPDALDEKIKLLPAKMWIAMIPLLLIVAVTAAWAFFGSIIIEVDGPGVITELSGNRNLSAKNGGTIKHILVELNQKVRKDQPLTVLDQHMAELELKQLMDKFILLEAQLGELLNDAKKELAKNKTDFQTELDSLKSHLRELSAACKYLREKHGEDFYKALKKSEESLAKNSRYCISNANENLIFTEYKSIWTKFQEMIFSENEMASKIYEFLNNTVLCSPVAGTITELFKKAGDKIMEGETVLSVTPDIQGTATATAFITANDSQKVKVNQAVHISPVNVEPEKHGYIIGKIRYISSTPETLETLSNTFRNRELVDFLRNGEQMIFKVIVELQPDNSSPGGVKWTYRAPKNMKLAQGTPCRISIITEKKQPVKYIFPWINQQDKTQGR